jgi:predicted metal-dependent hydrolase
MRSGRTPKKKPEDLKRTGLRELEMATEDWQEFEHGVQLFNSGKFWHSHEAWEEVWRRHDEDERVFLQGIIQLAAAYHQLVGRKSFKGMMNNFDKAYAKLEVFRPEYLGVQVDPLLEAIRWSKEEALRLGDHDLESFNVNKIPKMVFRKPTNPDLMVGMRDFIRSAEFGEGLKNFNSGYFWEAHEIWEESWRDQDAEAKEFAQSFVQLASGYSFLKQGKVGSAKYILEKAVERLRQFEYLECGVEITPLIQQLEAHE